MQRGENLTLLIIHILLYKWPQKDKRVCEGTLLQITLSREWVNMLQPATNLN
jgi:hypothetical protein